MKKILKNTITSIPIENLDVNNVLYNLLLDASIAHRPYSCFDRAKYHYNFMKYMEKSIRKFNVNILDLRMLLIQKFIYYIKIRLPEKIDRFINADDIFKNSYHAFLCVDGELKTARNTAMKYEMGCAFLEFFIPTTHEVSSSDEKESDDYDSIYTDGSYDDYYGEEYDSW